MLQRITRSHPSVLLQETQRLGTEVWCSRRANIVAFDLATLID